MTDIHAPLGGRPARRAAGRAGVTDRRASKAGPRGPLADRLGDGLPRPTARPAPWTRWLGAALIGAGLVGAWMWFQPTPSDPGAVASIDRTSVEAPLGPVVDLRRPKPDPVPVAEREPSPSVVVLNDPAPEPEVLPAVASRPAASRHPDHLPRLELVEDAEIGPLPRIGDDGTTPFEAYRVAGPVAASRVAIVIGGLGLSQTGTQKAIRDLPASVTLAFSPDGNSLGRWTQAARKAGHELAVQVPLAPIGFPEISDSPRTVALDDDIAASAERSLARIGTYATVVGHGGGGFAPDAAAMTLLLRSLAARGLGYVDDGGVRASRAGEAAKSVKLPFVAATLVLDDEADAAAIDRQLERLVAEARRTGRAVGTGAALPRTIERVALFAKAAAKKGVTIVPVSNLMERR